MNDSHHSRLQLRDKGRVSLCDTVDTSSTRQNYLVDHLLVVNRSVGCAKVDDQLCTGSSSRLSASTGRRGISGSLQTSGQNSTHHHLQLRESRKDEAGTEQSNLTVLAKGDKQLEQTKQSDTSGQIARIKSPEQKFVWYLVKAPENLILTLSECSNIKAYFMLPISL